MKHKFKIRFSQDAVMGGLFIANKYEVVSITDLSALDGIGTYEQYIERDMTPKEISVFKGSLSDCEIWIRLHENGYID